MSDVVKIVINSLTECWLEDGAGKRLKRFTVALALTDVHPGWTVTKARGELMLGVNFDDKDAVVI